MNAIEALEYLERVVEFDADIDPDIHEAIAVLHSAIERNRDTAALMSELDSMISWYGRRGTDDELLPADQQEPEVQQAMQMLASETLGRYDEISSD